VGCVERQCEYYPMILLVELDTRENPNAPLQYHN
jgi:hypothetical protein